MRQTFCAYVVGLDVGDAGQRTVGIASDEIINGLIRRVTTKQLLKRAVNLLLNLLL